jgi:hypothetical protein
VDELLALLDVARWPLRYQCKVTRSPHGATFQRGGMQAAAIETRDGLIEVTYEHAPHYATRECCTPSEAGRLLRLVFHREHLCKVDRDSA